MEFSDSEIIENAIAGNMSAFKILVERYQSFAFSLSFRLLGNSQDAEDIVQEAFIKVWKHLDKFRKEVKFTTWLYKIVTNLCLDYLKSQNYRSRLYSKDISKEYFIAGDSDPEKERQFQELMEILKNLSNELTPKQKAVFVLRDLEQLEVEEIMSILKISSGKIKSNLYYARMKINSMLKDYYGNCIREEK